ncbi:putative flavoprotein [Mycobacterium sp. JS623]|uniref:NADPH-dependent FMN reductase n=1 Tax=Mycobacterium sp. JS623 TaxID=212767 RepID=UPI0002A54F81|nr:NADPH-dependent FMN reductase [Mycobacterium sp. JS623]AGB22218.1 putative flavoprotein [Mycobacterium sp. JS623]
MIDQPLHVVGIGGTVRPGSSTEQALRSALARVEAMGATTTCFGGAELSELAMYDPRSSARSSMAMFLLSELRKADAIVIASPGYHGGVSGLVKNALDYTEDLRADPRPYFHGLPVGCIATGAGWQGVVTTLNQLRTIVHALRGWPTPLGIGINTVETTFDSDGRGDSKLEKQLTVMQQELFGSASLHRRAAWPAQHVGT